MDWAVVFKIANLMALTSWVVLIFLPRRWELIQIVPRYVVPLLLSVAYAALVLVYFAQADGGFDSLENVKKLFGSDAMVLAGWLHYLAFDLFVGCWIAREADGLGLHRVLQAPVLFLTFMFGPVGYLVFMAVKLFFRQQVKA